MAENPPGTGTPSGAGTSLEVRAEEIGRVARTIGKASVGDLTKTVIVLAFFSGIWKWEVLLRETRAMLGPGPVNPLLSVVGLLGVALVCVSIDAIRERSAANRLRDMRLEDERARGVREEARQERRDDERKERENERKAELTALLTGAARMADATESMEGLTARLNIGLDRQAVLSEKLDEIRAATKAIEAGVRELLSRGK